jgi:hypothetical protein
MSTGGERYLYDVISTALGIEDLNKRVSERLESGWRCVGGISLATIETTKDMKVVFSQAIVRSEYK